LLLSIVMCATLSAARRRERVAKPSRGNGPRPPSTMVISEPGTNLTEGASFSLVDLGDSVRLALMVTPRGRSDVPQQVQEALSAIRTVLEKQPQPMTVTVQTVFLRDARDQVDCARAFAKFYGAELPVTNFVLQPPCCGASLAVEAWASIGRIPEAAARNEPQRGMVR